jgi:hypothetical protein
MQAVIIGKQLLLKTVTPEMFRAMSVDAKRRFLCP